MAGKIVLIYGYPGSGKTTYGDKLIVKINATKYIDDYHKDSTNNSSKFENGREYNEMAKGLKEGETWMASDVEWCRKNRRDEVIEAIKKIDSDIKIEWYYFPNNENLCKDRVKIRGCDKIVKQLQKIDDLSKDFSIHEGANPIENCEV